ncbi:hypothetical protein KR054_000351 [Drosophila jambulina]|nr:hypothetical protein KR054_000351 [Drosophila jambulina]
MNNPWREMGFIAKRRPTVHLKIVRVKKRLGKAKKQFQEDRNKLIELKLRNHVKNLLVVELEKQLGIKQPGDWIKKSKK